MSSFDNLIKEFKKDIEYKKLEEICEIKRGERITKKDLVVDGKYSAISGGEKPFGKINKYNREKDTITIAQYGSAGFIDFQKEKFWANDVCYSLFPNQSKVDNKFLFYSLKNIQNKIYSLTTKAIPNHLPIEKLKEIKLPIPPLETQNKIVNILDNFSKYEAELEAELVLRNKQYEYYRNKLLSFDNLIKDVEYKKLEEICEIKRGKVISKNYINANKGKFPVYSSQTINEGIIGKISSYDFDGEYITWTTDGIYAGTAFYRKGKFSITNICGLLKVKVNNILPKFIYYYLKKDMRNYVNKSISNPKLMSNKVAEIQIPIPPLETQNKIVNILDKFNTLLNDINEGLPKEKELRKKQYEHYRNKLLGFE